jgi:superfamily I DNA/RNA helicase
VDLNQRELLVGTFHSVCLRFLRVHAAVLEGLTHAKGLRGGRAWCLRGVVPPGSEGERVRGLVEL